MTDTTAIAPEPAPMPTEAQQDEAGGYDKLRLGSETWQPIETFPKDGRIVVVYTVYVYLERGDNDEEIWITQHAMETSYWAPDSQEVVNNSEIDDFLTETNEYKIVGAFWRDVAPPVGLPAARGYESYEP